jgi:acetyl-CoA acetyltransferase
MGKRSAALVGFTEWAPQRKWDNPMFSMEACAKLAFEVLADAGLEKDEVDGLVIGGLQESPLFAPLALAEYLQIPVHFAEIVDIGGASSAGMIWRAAAAIEVGLCEAVLVLVHSTPAPVESGGDAAKMIMPPYLMAMLGDPRRVNSISRTASSRLHRPSRSLPSDTWISTAYRLRPLQRSRSMNEIAHSRIRRRFFETSQSRSRMS